MHVMYEAMWPFGTGGRLVHLRALNPSRTTPRFVAVKKSRQGFTLDEDKRRDGTVRHFLTSLTLDATSLASHLALINGCLPEQVEIYDDDPFGRPANIRARGSEIPHSSEYPASRRFLPRRREQGEGDELDLERDTDFFAEPPED